MELQNPDYYINRELSLLAFNRRVLELAADETVPPLERLRFLCISSTNLDEFFEIRVSGLKEQIKLGIDTRGPDNLSPAEQLAQVSLEAHALVKAQYEELNDALIPALAREGIRFLRRTQWTPEQAQWVAQRFREELFPLLSPLSLDPAHPFPRVQNKSLNFIVTLHGEDAFGYEREIAIVQAPRALPRLIKMPEELADCPHGFVFLSSVIHAHVGELFPGMSVTGCFQFRVTRNTDLFVDEEDVADLREALSGELPYRNLGEAVRLEIADNCTEEARELLREELGLDEVDTYQVHGLVNLNRLSQLYDQIPRPDLKYRNFKPGLPTPLLQTERSLFDVLAQQDILLHHPYQSFAPILTLLRQAANDPAVLAIKQTLYRTGVNSEVVKLLQTAALRGKEVTIVIELKARFDEEANIELANRLQDAGCHVVYGVVGHKTHAKMLMIIRREGGGLRHYVHLGTGNYHPGTSRAYTDIGLLTSNPDIGRDVQHIFRQLTGLCRTPPLQKLHQAPFTLHQGILDKIQREASNARDGKPARIIARMNALVEPEIIRALYLASQGGVAIDLIVRGVCCLRPGVPGISENINVRSVMGRFLEHARVFYFENGGDPEVYCSSADWMPRNFFRRIETCFPIEAPDLKARVIRETLEYYVTDRTQAWLLDNTGGYTRATADASEALAAQERLMEELGSFGS
ncbi:MAG: polyphosphate kinase 1 [Thiotrichales bacterium]